MRVRNLLPCATKLFLSILVVYSISVVLNTFKSHSHCEIITYQAIQFRALRVVCIHKNVNLWEVPTERGVCAQHDAELGIACLRSLLEVVADLHASSSLGQRYVVDRLEK